MIDQKELKKVYLCNLEESIISRLAEIKDIDIDTAMRIYYSSKLSDHIERGESGIEYLDCTGVTYTNPQVREDPGFSLQSAGFR